MENSKGVRGFLKRKDVIISPKRYLHDSMSAMGIALFSSMVIGMIFKTIGEQLASAMGANMVTDFLVTVGTFAMSMMGPAIGVAVAITLDAPLLVVVSTGAVGQMGAEFTGFGIETVGGPGGAFLAAIVGCEFGKLISKEDTCCGSSHRRYHGKICWTSGGVAHGDTRTGNTKRR